jgi:lipopolysaccharide export system ATP-binding protein
MGDLLREFAEGGTAVILADHHVAEALRVCDRAVLLIDGKVEASGAPEAFREDSLVQSRYLGSLDQGRPNT